MKSCAGVCNPFWDANVNGSRIGSGTSATSGAGRQIWVGLGEALYIREIGIGKFLLVQCCGQWVYRGHCNFESADPCKLGTVGKHI